MKETRRVHIAVTSNAATSMTKGTVAAKGLSTSLKGVGASANLATGGIKAMAMALVSSGVGAVVVAVGALIAGFSGLVNKSREFSKSLSTLGAISGATGKPLENLAKNAKLLGSTTAFTATEVLELSTELAKLGFDSPMIVAASKGILDLAAASGTDLASAASIAAGTLRGFGLDAGETGRVADVMANSFSQSGLDIEKFRESIKLVAPIAKVTSVSLEDTTAALSILADRQISGSMAGTQLKRIMSDLAMKTGKDFQTSLEDTAVRLSKATSASEKLAIAKDLVGDRAKGSLIALAENTTQLKKLSIEYNRTGVAAEKAAKMLDNLDGDITKLSSAWDGFMLGLEDGEGIISQLSRGAVTLVTGMIEKMSNGIKTASAAWVEIVFGFNSIGYAADVVVDSFQRILLKVGELAVGVKQKLIGVPFIGDGITQESIDSDLRMIEQGYSLLDKSLDDSEKKQAKLREEKEKAIANILYGHLTNTQLTNKKIVEDGKNTTVALTEEQKKRLEEEKQLRKDFLAKFKKMEEDAEDTSSYDKIRRKRERHLAELKVLVMDTEEKEKLKQRIETYYAGLLEIEKDKAIKKVQAGLGGTTAEDKLQQRRLDHLAELDAIEMEETEKAELRKRINEFYDKEKLSIEQANKLIADKKAQDIRDQEEADRQAKIEGMYSVLDTAADIAGQESDIARALQAIKLAIQLSELGVKMGIIKQGLFAKAQAAQTEATIEGGKVATATASGLAETSKVGFPWNVITMASYALQAASLIKAFSGSKGKLDAITSKAGVGGGGSSVAQPTAVAAPSFNVLGGVSAGENLIANTVAQNNRSVMRAYVVESDISTSQSLRRNAESLASVG